MTTNSKLFGFIVATLLVYAVVIGSIGLFRSSNNLPSELATKWQAVFLSDGQVYFGHLADVNDEFSKLTDVYYLKYGNKLQQENSNLNQDATSQNLNLVKLGGEVHGPEDAMFISKDKIMFIEILKNTSTVLQAIQRQR